MRLVTRTEKKAVQIYTLRGANKTFPIVGEIYANDYQSFEMCRWALDGSHPNYTDLDLRTARECAHCGGCETEEPALGDLQQFVDARRAEPR